MTHFPRRRSENDAAQEPLGAADSGPATSATVTSPSDGRLAVTLYSRRASPLERLGPYAAWLCSYCLNLADDRHGQQWCLRSEVVVLPGTHPEVTVILQVAHEYDSAEFGQSIMTLFQSVWDEDMGEVERPLRYQ